MVFALRAGQCDVSAEAVVVETPNAQGKICLGGKQHARWIDFDGLERRAGHHIERQRGISNLAVGIDGRSNDQSPANGVGWNLKSEIEWTGAFQQRPDSAGEIDGLKRVTGIGGGAY